MSDRDRRRRRDGAGHVAASPDFPELTTFGDDRDEALARAVGALEEAVAARIHRAALAGERDGRPPDARIAGSEVHNRGTDARAAGGAGTGSMKQAETGSDPRAARRKLPIGIRTFREIREEGCYYVDKTAYVRRLMDEGKHYFLSRPRRFGKSLLVDTIEELFEGNEPLFRGLAVHDRWDWSTPHPVLHLDFGGGSYGEHGLVHKEAASRLGALEREFAVTRHDETAPARFQPASRTSGTRRTTSPTTRGTTRACSTPCSSRRGGTRWWRTAPAAAG